MISISNSLFLWAPLPEQEAAAARSKKAARLNEGQKVQIQVGLASDWPIVQRQASWGLVGRRGPHGGKSREK